MIKDLVGFIENILDSVGAFAPFLSCILIFFESILPFLPLCVFITINFLYFGTFLGFIISWIFTCLGCFFSYYLVTKGIVKLKKFDNKRNQLLDRYSNYIKKISLSFITLLIAIPFTPAFMINIAAGYTKMNFKKFAISICIGKIFMIYFWGFIGVSLIDSIKNPSVLIKIIILVGISYIVSFLFNKFLKKSE